MQALADEAEVIYMVSSSDDNGNLADENMGRFEGSSDRIGAGRATEIELEWELEALRRRKFGCRGGGR